MHMERTTLRDGKNNTSTRFAEVPMEIPRSLRVVNRFTKCIIRRRRHIHGGEGTNDLVTRLGPLHLVFVHVNEHL